MDADFALFEDQDVAADELALSEGEADADAGRVVDHAEVVKWLRTWGTLEYQPPPPEWFE